MKTLTRLLGAAAIAAVLSTTVQAQEVELAGCCDFGASFAGPGAGLSGNAPVLKWAVDAGGQNAGGTTFSHTITAGANSIASGDMLVVFCTTSYPGGSTNSTYSLSAGTGGAAWHQLATASGNFLLGSVFYKIANASEPGSYTASYSGGTASATKAADCLMTDYGGVYSFAPLTGTGIMAYGGTSSPSIGGLTTGTDKAKVLWFGAMYGGPDRGPITGVTSGYSQVVKTTDVTTMPDMVIFDSTKTPAGATGTVGGAGTGSIWISGILALNPQ